MRISVYVPCRNAESTLPEALAALRQQTRPPDQLLFINDHCTDRSPDIARQHGFVVQELLDTRGLAAGRNRALKCADGDVLIGVDSDVVVSPDYVEKIQAHFEANPKAAAIGGRLIEKFTDTPPNLWRALHMPQHHGDQPRVNPRLLYGATMSIRTVIAKLVRGWDERYLSHYEDMDICTRLKSSGLTMLYLPDCTAWHLRRDTLESVLHGFWKYNYYGMESCFRDIANWLRLRSKSYWSIHERVRMQEMALPQLSYITLLLPWSWAIRDLHALQANVPDAGSIADIPKIAREAMERNGFDGKLIAQTDPWLTALAGQVNPNAAALGPLKPEITASLLSGASEALKSSKHVVMLPTSP